MENLLNKFKMTAQKFTVSMDDNVAATIPTGLVQPAGAGGMKPFDIVFLDANFPSTSGFQDYLEGYTWTWNTTTGVVTVTPQFSNNVTGVMVEVAVLYKY